jgi:hypothetical protein
MKNILLVRSGSRAYGVHTDTSDYDTTGICLEDFASHLSIDKHPFEQYHRTEDDGTVYSLSKFCRLASAGNPNIIEVLYSPVLEYTAEGNELIENRQWFWSKRAGSAFLGYIKAQKERLLGERGQKDVNRRDLVAKFGYDTKYAYHIIRLGIIGNEFLTCGYIQLPLADKYVQMLKDIREGKWTLASVIKEAEHWESNLKFAVEHGVAPTDPQISNINDWLRSTYMKHWSSEFCA